MTPTQAQTLREAHDGYVQSIYRKSKAALASMYREELADRGMYTLFGGPSGKDELVSALVELRYPLAKMNESVHVLYHVDGITNDVCEHCAAVARVVARGSDPAAAAEAEGDFGPGGLYA